MIRRRMLMSVKKTSMLPAEYQQVYYIEGTNNQYIDTNSFDLANDKIYLKFQIRNIESGNFRVYGARKAFQDTNKTIFYNFDEKYGLGVDYSKDSQNAYRYLTRLKSNDDIVEVNLGQQIDIRINGELVSSQFKNYIFDSAYTACIFQYNKVATTQEKIMRCYRYKKWRNDTLVLDMIPCYRKSDSKSGMYDLINGNFFTDKSGGNFIVGKNI